MVNAHTLLALLRAFFPTAALLIQLTPDIVEIIRDIIVSAIDKADSAYADGDNVAKHVYVDGLLSSDIRLAGLDLTEDIRIALIRFVVKMKRVANLFTQKPTETP